jgi:Fic family protein
VKRNDLHPKIRSQYNEKKGCGVEKLDESGYHNIWFVIPPALPRNPIQLSKQEQMAVFEALSKANKVFNKLKTYANMDNIDRLITYLFSRQEAVVSSRIEGTFSTIDEALSLQDENTDIRSASQSVRSYAKSLELVYENINKNKFDAITVELFKDLHKQIIGRDPDFSGIPGEFRTPGEPGSIVQIGGLGRKDQSIYNPAPPRHVSWLMDNFVAWLSDPVITEAGDAGLGNTLSVRMALAHAHFEAIHPFTDGNGRVGRIIWPMQMILSGYMPLYLSGYLEQKRNDYFDALELFQKKLRPLAMINFMGDAISHSFEEMQRSKQALIDLSERWRKNLKPRKGSGAGRLLDILLGVPILDVNEVSSRLNISFPTASKAISQLEKAGILYQRSSGKRNRIFAAEEVIAIVSRHFGQDPKDAIEIARKRLKIEGEKSN